jgi:nitric oxide reductase NorQ protein
MNIDLFDLGDDTADVAATPPPEAAFVPPSVQTHVVEPVVLRDKFLGLPIPNSPHSTTPDRDDVIGFVPDPRHEKHIGLFVHQRVPLILIGPTGSGKTQRARWLAYQLRCAYYEIAHNAQLEFDDLVIVNEQDEFGRWKKRAGDLLVAFSQGGIACLDEMFAIKPSVAQRYHSFLSSKRYFIPGLGWFQRHPDFRVVATGNDWRKTPGNYEPGEPLLDRGLIIRCEYLAAQEEAEAILNHVPDIKPGVATDLATFADAWRKGKAANPDSASYDVSTRALVATCMYVVKGDMTLAEAVDAAIVTPARVKAPDDVENLVRMLRATVSDEIPE